MQLKHLVKPRLQLIQSQKLHLEKYMEKSDVPSVSSNTPSPQTLVWVSTQGTQLTG